MAVSSIPPASGRGQPPGIDDFRREATLGDEVRVQIDGDSLKLIASGRTPSGRTVAWVDSGDASAVFVAALADAYGGRLSAAVANELGLTPAPGKPLASRTVEQALSMAETASAAIDGVRFAEQLERKGSD